jgi:phosphate acetyltransferase
VTDFLADIRRRAAARPRTIVLPEGADARVLDAAARLVEESLARPVLIGPGGVLADEIRTRGVEPGAVPLIDPHHYPRRDECAAELVRLLGPRGVDLGAAMELATDPLMLGALLVRLGVADGSVAGACHATAEVLRAALRIVGPAKGIRTVSSSFYMVVQDFRGLGPEVLSFTDAGVVPDPDAEQLADIAVAAVEARGRLVGDEPRVAFLSFSTRGSADCPSVGKVRAALDRFRARLPTVAADGELQADAALIDLVAERKAPGSPVGGRANILVFPDLDAGNIAYKLVQRLAGATAIGPVLQGLDRPCNDLSRGASVDDIVHAACITSLLA